MSFGARSADRGRLVNGFTSSGPAVAEKASDIEERVRELLARMTLDQKIGQMTQPERMHASPAEVKRYHIGSVLSGGGSCPGDNRPADWVAMNDAYWTASMEEDDDHLAIPLLYGVDAIHGNANVLGATIFPHNIGLGAMRDPDLVERIGRVTAREVRAAGVDWTFAPTLAVARDPRWGRTYESYSEDPGVVGGYAGRIVRGLQGGASWPARSTGWGTGGPATAWTRATRLWTRRNCGVCISRRMCRRWRPGR